VTVGTNPGRCLPNVSSMAAAPTRVATSQANALRSIFQRRRTDGDTPSIGHCHSVLAYDVDARNGMSVCADGPAGGPLFRSTLEMRAVATSMRVSGTVCGAPHHPCRVSLRRRVTGGTRSPHVVGLGDGIALMRPRPSAGTLRIAPQARRGSSRRLTRARGLAHDSDHSCQNALETPTGPQGHEASQRATFAGGRGCDCVGADVLLNAPNWAG
jgi:hypothetical protein